MSEPVIGIFTYRFDKQSAAGTETETSVQNTAYTKAVERSGGIPLLIPYSLNNVSISALLELCDGLLIPGGDDVDPSKYGEKQHKKLDAVDPRLDDSELFSLDRAVTKNMPVFGICRGMQLINVYFGGTLYQDLPTQRANALNHRQAAPRATKTHPVNISKNTILSSVISESTVMVNSLHHQSVRKLGNGLIVSAVAPDGVIEAFEHKNGRIFAVQWHPEELTDDAEILKLFTHFVEICGKN